MREKLEISLCYVTSVLVSIYFMLYVMQEKELLRFVFGTFLIALCVFAFLMWIFEIVKVREKRKNKKKAKSIDDLSLE